MGRLGHESTFAPLTLVLLGALLLVLGASPSAAGIKVAILRCGCGGTGRGAERQLRCVDRGDRGGLDFNGFDLSIGYDHTALTFMQRSPVSLQEGSYFVAACPSGRFHMFQAGTDSLAITDVLLCAGASVTGPGQIYKLRFKASIVPQVTTLRFLKRLAFYNEGTFVTPVTTTNAQVTIGTSLAVPAAPRDVPMLHLSAAPNPARGHVVLRIDADRAGPQRLLVTDVTGRSCGAGARRSSRRPRSVTWDSRNDSGQVVAPRRYIATLKTAGRRSRP
jgi:hypothetical protein